MTYYQEFFPSRVGSFVPNALGFAIVWGNSEQMNEVTVGPTNRFEMIELGSESWSIICVGGGGGGESNT